MIPKQLQRNEFRFVKLGKGGVWAKRPIEAGYIDVKNYLFDSDELKSHLESGFNYGILGGKGNLLIIDFDDEYFQDNVMQLLPDTFVVKSGGKGLCHMYFVVDEIFNKFPLKNNEGRTLADMICGRAFVVGPNCQHESGRKYEVINDSSIAKIKIEDLKKIFNYWKEVETKKVVVDTDFKGVVDEVMRKKTIREVLARFGVNSFVRNNRYRCPLHPGHNDYNAYVDDTKQLWFCHSCGRGGNVYNLVMENEKCSFIDALNILKEM